MKILFFCSGSVMYGKENVTLDVIKGMKTRGHTVEAIFSGWHDGRFQRALINIGIAAHPLKLGWYYLTKPLWSIDSLVNYLPSIIKYVRIVREFKPDIIFADSFRNVVLLHPFINQKVLFHVHDPHSHNRAIKMLVRFANPKIFRYISVSEYIKEDLIDVGIKEDKIEVVHNGVSVADVTGRTYMPDGILRIGIVGQIIPRKGHEQLFKAVSLLEKDVNFEVHVFGSGYEDYKTQLKQLIADININNKVIWHPFESDKKNIYNNIDVLVAPAVADEPFGLTPVEAAMHQLPVIVYKSGGLSETVKHEATGWVVEKFDIKELANKLELLYRNSNILLKMGTAAREFALKEFTIDIMNEKINCIIEGAMK